MGYLEEKNEEIDYLKTRNAALGLENSDIKKRNQDSQLLVAGAMRQGFMNKTQRDALMYAFMALTGETSETCAMLMVWIQPRGYAQLALPKPKDEPVKDYQV